MEDLQSLRVQELKSLCTELNIEIPQSVRLSKIDYISMIQNKLGSGHDSNKYNATPVLEEYTRLNEQELVEQKAEQQIHVRQDAYNDGYRAPANNIKPSTNQPNAFAQAARFSGHQKMSSDPPCLKGNQSSDVFARMMAAKFDKNPPVQKIGFNFRIIIELAVAAGVVVFVIMLGLLAYSIYEHLMKETVFCNTGQLALPDCTPCPPHGYCTQGLLTCDKGYIRDRDTCVENKQLDVEAIQMLNRLEEAANEQAVAVICNDIEQDGYLNIEQKELYDGLTLSEPFEYLLERLREKIESGGSPKLERLATKDNSIQVKIKSPELPLL